MRPSSLEDVCGAVGYRATRILAAWFAGRQFYVPGEVRPSHPLATLLGPSAFRALVLEFGYGRINVPARRDDDVYFQKRTIAEWLAQGMTPGEVAERTDLTRRRVEQIRRELVREGWLEYASGVYRTVRGSRPGRPARRVDLAGSEFLRTGKDAAE